MIVKLRKVDVFNSDKCIVSQDFIEEAKTIEGVKVESIGVAFIKYEWLAAEQQQDLYSYLERGPIEEVEKFEGFKCFNEYRATIKDSTNKNVVVRLYTR